MGKTRNGGGKASKKPEAKSRGHEWGFGARTRTGPMKDYRDHRTEKYGSKMYEDPDEEFEDDDPCGLWDLKEK